MADPGEGHTPPPSPPPFLDQTEARRAKTFFRPLPDPFAYRLSNAHVRVNSYISFDVGSRMMRFLARLYFIFSKTE